MTDLVSGNDVKERLSVAYVTAVAARAGCEIVEPKKDKQSIDAMVLAMGGRPRQINLQLKATSNQIDDGDSVSFELPIKNYDDLRTSNTFAHYLVVLVLPQESSEWLALSSSELILRGRAYYANLKGLPEVANTSTRTIHIPSKQRFGVEALEHMLEISPQPVGTLES